MCLSLFFYFNESVGKMCFLSLWLAAAGLEMKAFIYKLLSLNYKLRQPLGNFGLLWPLREQVKVGFSVGFHNGWYQGHRAAIRQGTGRSEHSAGVFPVMVRALRVGGQAVSPCKEPWSVEIIIIWNEDQQKGVMNSQGTSGKNEYHHPMVSTILPCSNLYIYLC